MERGDRQDQGSAGQAETIGLGIGEWEVLEVRCQGQWSARLQIIG